MIHYSIFEWIAFFMIYCLIGWIWESLYVSWEYKQWTNRGFLNGPFLPIYGFGAIIMLFSTLAVRDNIFLTFLFGSLSATLLEYVTGASMEKIFHARYWDYSNRFLNLNGHICLKCSVVWGVASVLLVNFLHKPIERLLGNFSNVQLIIFDIIFVCYFSWDLVISVRQAIDLRKFIDEQILQNENVKRMQKRLDVLIAVTEDNKEKAQEWFEEKLEAKEKKVEAEVAKIKAEMEEAKKKFEEKTAAYKKRAMRIAKRNPKAAIRLRIDKKDILKEKVKEKIYTIKLKEWMK